MMNVKILGHPDELDRTAPFEISHLLWGTKAIPRTYFYIGFVPGDGFYVRMVCEEANPLRTYTAINDPVYQDSSMEAFFHFDPAGSYSPIYLNFEMNANGAILAAYGRERVYRSNFTPEQYDELCSSARIEDNRWIAEFKIPVSILERIYGRVALNRGDTFTCNFYKISEDASIEHYASYSPILTSIPSFHLTEYFATARLE